MGVRKADQMADLMNERDIGIAATDKRAGNPGLVFAVQHKIERLGHGAGDRNLAIAESVGASMGRRRLPSPEIRRVRIAGFNKTDIGHIGPAGQGIAQRSQGSAAPRGA